MTLHLYNTLTRTAEPFAPLAPPTVTMYVCGPTVYDDPHLGHARSAYIFDVLRRYLEFSNFQVRFVRNVTDVDDKIIEKAKQQTGDRGQGTGDLKATCVAVAERYLQRYHETMDRLGLRGPDLEPKATEHVVPVMTDFIAKLLMQGAAYEAGGDVYFSVRKFEGYGRLSNRTVDELQAGARVEPGGHKQDPLDFALWKSAKPDEPSWNSPWGAGRPGWHIECSAMSTKYLGEAFDIHGGGVDLVFPHHENEIAQARAAGKPFARWWVHNGLLTVNGEKMSKSLGNYITVNDALDECDNKADVLKVFFLGAHYRSPIDYTRDGLKVARRRWHNFYHLYLSAENCSHQGAKVPKELPEALKELRKQFISAMDDDLNTPRALAALDGIVGHGYECIKALYGSKVETTEEMRLRNEVLAAGALLKSLGEDALGVFGNFGTESIPEPIQQKAREREIARESKNFKKADEIRNELEALGFVVEDTKQGPLIIRRG
ncbi:MAG: cysteine--tRNA ligase [Candidatus Omnitrophica bacterium]|nr:cysteine--tRNA ligase [Candidatus Omnitrophota bacterium]